MKSYVDIKYKIYDNYKKFKKISQDDIQEVNDEIINMIDNENFNNPILELYNTVAICMYMIDNNLYDKYFFDSYKEILSEIRDKEFDDILRKDIDNIEDYIKKDLIKGEYYDKLSEIYDE